MLQFNNTVASGSATNDFPPLFNGSYVIDVPEDTTVGTLLLSAAAVDPDVNVTNPGIDYAIVDPPNTQRDANGSYHVGPFRITAAMDVFLASAVDFESSPTHYAFSVSASDRGPPFSRTSIQRVVINVSDSNDNAPEFDSAAYFAVVNFDTVVGSTILTVRTTDADSVSGANYTILSGNENGTFALEEDTGVLTLVRSPVRRLSTEFNLVIQAEDFGVPSLLTEVNATITFANSDFTVTISTGVLYEEFIRNVDPSTGENRCVRDLEAALGYDLYVVGVARGAGTDADLSFYLEDVNTSAILPTSQVTNLLVSQNSAVSALQSCQITSVFQDVSSGEEAFVEHFSDSTCNTSVGTPGGSFGDPGLCIADPVAQRSARIACTAFGLLEGQVDVRVYDNVGCGSPTLLVATTSPNGSQTNQSSQEGACLPIGRVLTSGSPQPDLYVRVRCVNRTTTTTTTSTMTSSSTASTVSTQTATTGTVSTSTVSSQTRTSSTTTTSTRSTSTFTSTNFNPELSAAKSSDGGDSSLLIALVIVGTLLIWIVVILVLLRQRRQKQQLERAKLMVLAHQGDLLFGDPEPMSREDAFSGGEIDPETGEIRLYRTDEDGVKMQGMPSMWSGMRNNPMFGDLGEDHDGEGYIDGEELDEDSLGELSDFDDADFEVSVQRDAILSHLCFLCRMFAHTPTTSLADCFSRPLPCL